MLLAGPISHTSTQDIDYVEILNISLDLSTIYFAHFSAYRASFVYSCHSILECCHVFWSQVEYRIVCFIYSCDMAFSPVSPLIGSAALT